MFPNNGIASELYEKIRQTCMPRGEFKHRYWFFTDTPNVAWNVSVIWKDLLWLWKADLYRLLKYRGGCTIPLFELSVWCEKCVASDTIALLGNNYCLQILETGFAEWFYASHRDGACTNFIENFSENSLKGDLSNNTTLNQPLFSLVNTFKELDVKLYRILNSI